MGKRRLGPMALICGLVVVVLAQRLAPLAGLPLYDGVVVTDPYRWLSPPPGLLGNAQSAQQSFSGQDLQGGMGIGTSELPPQIQVATDFGSLAIPAATTAITISIEPVNAPAVPPPDGVVAGNVYDVAFTNQIGTPINPKAHGSETVVLRGPPNLPDAKIERYSAGRWADLPTTSAGIPNMFVANPIAFGEFALVAPDGWLPDGEVAPSAAAAGSIGSPEPSDATASAPPPDSGLPWAPIAGAAVLALIAGTALLWLLDRRANS